MKKPTKPLASAGKIFSIVAVIEACTWAGLLVGMYLKYGSATTDLGVRVFGWLHGGAFLLYLMVAVIVGARLRWPMWALLLAVLAAIPPLTTLPLEYGFRRRGLLSIPDDPAGVVENDPRKA